MAFQHLPSLVLQSDKMRITTTAVPLSPGTSVIAVANPARIAFFVWNNSANSIYLTFGPTSSSATPTFILATFATYPNLGPVIWTGAISATRNAGAGNATVYEILAP